MAKKKPWSKQQKQLCSIAIALVVITLVCGYVYYQNHRGENGIASIRLSEEDRYLRALGNSRGAVFTTDYQITTPAEMRDGTQFLLTESYRAKTSISPVLKVYEILESSASSDLPEEEFAAWQDEVGYETEMDTAPVYTAYDRAAQTMTTYNRYGDTWTYMTSNIYFPSDDHSHTYLETWITGEVPHLTASGTLEAPDSNSTGKYTFHFDPASASLISVDYEDPASMITAHYQILSEPMRVTIPTEVTNLAVPFDAEEIFAETSMVAPTIGEIYIPDEI